MEQAQAAKLVALLHELRTSQQQCAHYEAMLIQRTDDTAETEDNSNSEADCGSRRDDDRHVATSPSSPCVRMRLNRALLSWYRFCVAA